MGCETSKPNTVSAPDAVPQAIAAAKPEDKLKPFAKPSVPGDIYKFGKDGKDALAFTLKPKYSPEYYKLQCDLYFTHLESRIADRVEFYCSLTCVRWEWPPWDLLTGQGMINIMYADMVDRDQNECIVAERNIRFYDVQPFGRAIITIYYGDNIKTRQHPIKIYEEFTFNDFGQVTFIEAWSCQQSEYLPGFDAEGWPIEIPTRLSYLIPGLGHITGEINVNTEAVQHAALQNKYVADYVERSKHFMLAVSEAHLVNGMKRNPLTGHRETGGYN